jgi:diguanylate cyclase (GGDEF)-like protein/PAS domain S-box-containing protein
MLKATPPRLDTWPAVDDEAEEVSPSQDGDRRVDRPSLALTAEEVAILFDGSSGAVALGRKRVPERRFAEGQRADVLDAFPANIALLDADGYIVAVNEGWRRFATAGALGYADYGIGTNYLTVCHEAARGSAADTLSVAKGIRSVLRGAQKSFSMEYPCHSPTQEAWYLLLVAPLGGSRPTGAAVMHLDITDRKRKELIAGRFAAAMDGMLDSVFLIDRATMRVTYVNNAACRLHGLTREELLSLAPWEAMSTSRADLERKYDAILASGGVGEPEEFHWLRRDGTRIWIEVRRHVQCIDGNVSVVVVVRDVDKRKEAESRIRYLNRVYAVLSHINGLIVRVRTREELYREACKMAVDQAGFASSWIGIVDPSIDRIVPVAAAGLGDEWLQDIKRRLLQDPDGTLGQSLAARAVRERKAFVGSDSGQTQTPTPTQTSTQAQTSTPTPTQTSTQAQTPTPTQTSTEAHKPTQTQTQTQMQTLTLFRDHHAKHGIRSLAVLPLMIADEPVGVFTLYAREADFFHDEEMRLLAELAGDVAFAIDHIEKQERLEYLAYYDSLTGLANRSLFLDRVSQHIRNAEQGRQRLAVCLLDVERFRNINDSLGRSAGDSLLRNVAEWLAAYFGDVKVLARIDADHFAVVIPEVPREDDIARTVEQLTAAFAAHSFRLEDVEYRLSLKVGIAMFPDHGADAGLVFKNAGAALTKAKIGGDRHLFFDHAMTQRVAGRLGLENQLRLALEREEFVLHYQPKVNLGTGEVVGAEALLRWQEPRTGLVSPRRFIPVLEETGLIFEVGRWVLRKAADDYLRWRRMGVQSVRIAVNVSALQLRHKGFIADMRQVIDIDERMAAGLELEITESLIMENVRLSIATLEVIRSMGISVAIDDFGTGFSSLSYLAKLPIDTLKVDRSFIHDLTTGPQGLSLVSTIINLAHSLKLKVVAEGVETEEQGRILRLLFCDEVQGFLFSKPLPAAAFEEKFLNPIA